MIEVRDIQDFSDYLDTLLNQTECDDIEFKSAAGGFPDSFWDTYSAFANMESLLSENAKAKLEEKFGFAVNSFEHNVLSVLALASDEEFVTNERLRYSLSLHKSQISELLKLMCQNQLLEPQGYGRGMRYYLPKDKLNVFRKEANITTLLANSATSDDNSATSEVIKTKKRMKKEDLWLMMENVCEDWISIENIVAATGLSYSYLRNTVIPQMIKEKQLVMMYPGTPNHPKQQYKHKE